MFNGIVRAALAASFGAVLGLSITAGQVQAQDYKALLAAPDRSDADRQNDLKRDAFKLLEFSGPKTGMRVLDMGAGGGYSTELMARAVGSSGKVWGQHNKLSERYLTRMAAPAMANTTGVERPFDSPVPDGVRDLDLITFFFTYHDTTFMEVDRGKMNKAMFDALKPGAFLIIADHSARPGEGATVGKTMHRIEEQTLKDEVLAAGFKLVGSADFLRNPGDPRTVSVHRSGIRNDEFVLKLQKPM